MFLLSYVAKSGNLAHLHDIKYFIFIIYKLILGISLSIHIFWFMDWEIIRHFEIFGSDGAI